MMKLKKLYNTNNRILKHYYNVVLGEYRYKYIYGSRWYKL